MNLSKLNTEKANLEALIEETDALILSVEKELQASFTSKADSDEITQKLTTLKTKRGALDNAVKSNDEAIKAELERLEEKERCDALTVRKKHVKTALSALDKSAKLADQLQEQLKIVLAENGAAAMTNQEIFNSPRFIIGKLANDLNLHGSLSPAHTGKPANSGDLERLQSNLSGQFA